MVRPRGFTASSLFFTFSRRRGRPSLPAEFGMILRIREDLLELDARRIRRLSQVIKDDVLGLDIDIGSVVSLT